jgi:RimJ/RimL family protein N-acetyltransferase
MKDEQKDRVSTRRLLLRPFMKSDRAAVLDLFSDARTMLYWSSEPITSLEEADDRIQQEIDWHSKEKCFNWAIALPDSNQFIGKICLFQFNEQNRRAEIGYVLHRKHWGKGYMSEAMEFMLAFAFGELGLHRIEADTDPENLPSLALLEKFGFQREGLFRDRWFVHDKWHDSVMLGLLKEIWNQHRDKPEIRKGA